MVLYLAMQQPLRYASPLPPYRQLQYVLRLARIETNVDSKMAKGQGILKGRL